MTSLTSKVLKTIAGTAIGLATAASVVYGAGKVDVSKVLVGTNYIVSCADEKKKDVSKVCDYTSKTYMMGTKGPIYKTNRMGGYANVEDKPEGNLDYVNAMLASIGNKPVEKPKAQKPTAPPKSVAPAQTPPESADKPKLPGVPAVNKKDESTSVVGRSRIGAAYTFNEDSRLFEGNYQTSGNLIFAGRVGSASDVTRKSIDKKFEDGDNDSSNDVSFVGNRKLEGREIISFGAGYVLPITSDLEFPLIAFWNKETGTQTDFESFKQNGSYKDPKTSSKTVSDNYLSFAARARFDNVLLQAGLEAGIEVAKWKKPGFEIGIFRKF